MDETGFRIGIGKDHLVVTKRRRAHYFGLPENRESATAIEAISSGGLYTPAFLILTGELHMARWYRLRELDGDTVLSITPSGYSNDQLALDWLKHFNKHTKDRVTGVWRLLIIDGHGSHHTRPFIQYALDHHILPFGLPPHMTHILQPLDVVVFQPLKHYHAEALEMMVRDGVVNITKLEFLGVIQEVRRQAFKESTILSAFRKTGISPFEPNIVLNALRIRLPQKTPSPELQMPLSQPSSLFSGTPTTYRQINKLAERLEHTVDEFEDLPEPTRDLLGRFIKGSLINAAELLQTRKDLSRTKAAEHLNRVRRAGKNQRLQSGGILTVEQGREMAR
jgi:hypothetical protein